MKSNFMSKIATDKIQTLLEEAARQNDSATAAESSVTSSVRVFSTVSEAEESFSFLHEKLFRIERWNSCSDVSSFMLYDETGNEKTEGIAIIGDFIKVTLPGSGKDDWVKVIEIYDTPNEVVLTVRPSNDPTDDENKETTSHFFTDDSTNNFCLQKKDEQINFYVIGLNEKSNTTETSGILETVRNVATAKLGHYLGVQKLQWKSFAESFFEIDK